MARGFLAVHAPTSTVNNMQGRTLRRWLLDESGQDLIEYGLLASIIAIAGVVFFPFIKTAMGVAFGNWGTGVYNLWEPDPPGA